MFKFLKKKKYNKSALEPFEREVIDLFLSPEQPNHGPIIYQLEHTPGVFRAWNDQGYRLTIARYDDWMTPLYDRVESSHVTAPLEGQPGDATFYIVIDEDGFFHELRVRAAAGELSPTAPWKADLTEVQPAFVTLETDERERFEALSTFLGVDEGALRRWADSSDATIRWNFDPDTSAPTGGDDALYDEFSALVSYVLFEDRSIIGGVTEDDVEYDGSDYRFISHSRELDNVFLGRDEILVDGTPYPSDDFRDFLLKFIFHTVAPG